MSKLEETAKKLARYESGIDLISGIHPSEILNQFKENKYWEGIKSSSGAIFQSAYFTLWQAMNLTELIAGGYLVPAYLHDGDYKKAAAGVAIIALLEFAKHFSSRPLWFIFRSNPYGPLRIPRVYPNQNLKPSI